MHEYYEFLEHEINDLLGITIGFNNLVAVHPYTFDQETRQGFFDRYLSVKEFQKITLSLFQASLNHEFEPELASLVINELPENMGWEYHRKLTSRQHRLPVFFRTDEVVPGKIAEIQCPASGWGQYELFYRLYTKFLSRFDTNSTFPQSLAEAFSGALKTYLNQPPFVHHILDNSSVPHGMRYFIQKTRQYGVQYYGYDKEVTPYNCNFIRCHDFVGLFYNNFARQRLAECEAGTVYYDLPPSTLFEEKMCLMFPFWETTRSYYSDAIRDIFPYSHLITPDGFPLEDGTWVTLEEFGKLPRSQRDYYFKYAGNDVNMNWGSKAVFFAGSLSGAKCQKFLEGIANDFAQKRYWLLQKSYLYNDTVQYITREGELKEQRAHSKFSGFYGPAGLMGVMAMQRPFHKVHGSLDTAISVGQ